MENLPGRGFGATCCACVSFAWEIVCDSTIENFVNWSSAAKSVLPCVAWKRKMLHDVTGGYQAYLSGRIMVGWRNERVRAKRCDAVDWDSA